MTTGPKQGSVKDKFKCWPAHKTHSLVQESLTYLLYWTSYSQFWVQISKFSLPWQRVSQKQVRMTSLSWPNPKPRNLVQKFLYKMYQSELLYSSVFIKITLASGELSSWTPIRPLPLDPARGPTAPHSYYTNLSTIKMFAMNHVKWRQLYYNAAKMTIDMTNVTCLLVRNCRWLGSGPDCRRLQSDSQCNGGDHPSEKTGTYGCIVPCQWSL